MTEAEEACPNDRLETAVEALNIPRENTDEGDVWVSEILEPEFWDESCAFAIASGRRKSFDRCSRPEIGWSGGTALSGTSGLPVPETIGATTAGRTAGTGGIAGVQGPPPRIMLKRGASISDQPRCSPIG